MTPTGIEALYLVQGLGHCGACHTPRGFAWQEKALDDSSPTYLSGALLDAWYAPDPARRHSHRPWHPGRRTISPTFSKTDTIEPRRRLAR